VNFSRIALFCGLILGSLFFVYISLADGDREQLFALKIRVSKISQKHHFDAEVLLQILKTFLAAVLVFVLINFLLCHLVIESLYEKYKNEQARPRTDLCV
jgi:hypothetical protein